jgi:putative phosphoribosyl transferase
MPFLDRADAGRQLAAMLARYKDRRPVVLALPRGGVPVAAEVAGVLDAPLDLILVRKIGVPFQPELAMGAVVNGPDPLVVRNEDVVRHAGISEAAFAEVRDRELTEIKRRRTRYLGGRAHPALKGRTVIVIDDGVATGATTRAALRSVRRRNPEWLILAVPVAPTETLQALADEADEIVCLEDYASFMAIGVYYSDFTQVSDEEVTAILARFPAEPSADAGASP